MTKKEEFKEFVRTKPELADYVNSGEMTWQKFYEMYDLYGTDRGVWDKFNKTNGPSLNGLKDLVKNVDLNSIQNHINTAQKALGFIQELTGKGAVGKALPKGPAVPRPINKFFED
jgi:hypothetical protein